MKFANILTNQIVEQAQLPRSVEINGQLTTTPGPEDFAAIGWRRVVNEEAPAAGIVVTGWTITETGPLTCDLTIATSVTQASLDAAAVAKQKAEARALLDSTDGLGRLLFTLGDQLRILINVERSRHSAAAITSQQMVDTLRAALQ
jgi:hypothetical protein